MYIYTYTNIHIMTKKVKAVLSFHAMIGKEKETKSGHQQHQEQQQQQCPVHVGWANLPGWHSQNFLQ